MKRGNQLNVRLDDDENAAFEEAAQIAGMSTSAWVRQQLRLAAMQELSRVGRRAPFLKPVPLIFDGNSTPV